MMTPQFDRNQHPTPLVRDFSRRAALGGLGAGLAAAVGLMTSVHRAVAQDGTPVADAPAFLDQWLVVWTQDPSQADALYVEDAVLEDVGTGMPYEGREAVRGHAEEIATGLPDRGYAIRSAFSTGDWAAAEFVFSGTYSGMLPGLPPGAGQAVSLPGVAIFELDGDMIRRESHYYDAYTLLVQLGALSAPGAEGTPSP